ncbi:MAG TPA: hypothetical protein VF941_02875 [Clostridia bacterium]
MKTPALTILEAVYGLSFNPNLPYAPQLEALAASGVLANKKFLNEAVFKLCELVDKQQKQIDLLTKIVDNLGKSTTEVTLPASDLNVPHPVANNDPTRPL